MRQYQVDWDIFITQRLPYVLRKMKQIAWLRSLLAPVIGLYARFLYSIDLYFFRAKTTPQVRLLRGALNSQFDPELRRIEIEDGSAESFLFIFNVSENKPTYLPKFISGGIENGFTVKVPTSLASDVAKINNFVNLYKLPSLQHKIVLI